jgi:elongation factor G
VGKFIRQSGGRGQYGHVELRIEPGERGSGHVIENKVVGGTIPKEYIPAVEDGVVEAAETGMLAGYPMVDITIQIIDGSFHEVDSSEIAFKMAGIFAFKEAVRKAGAIMLEPIMDVEAITPQEHMGNVIGDLNSRRGRVLRVDAKGNYQMIEANVPMSEMLKYAPDLNSKTGGRGTFTMEFSHYEEVPSQMTEKVIAQVKKDKEKED